MTPTEPQAAQADTKRRRGLIMLSVRRLATVRRAFEGTDKAFAIAIHLALHSIATLQGSPRVKATVATIAGHAGLRITKAREILAAMEKARLIEIHRSRKNDSRTMQGASVYVLPKGTPRRASQYGERASHCEPRNTQTDSLRDTPKGVIPKREGVKSPCSFTAGASAFAGWGCEPPRSGRQQDGHHKPNAT